MGQREFVVASRSTSLFLRTTMNHVAIVRRWMKRAWLFVERRGEKNIPIATNQYTRYTYEVRALSQSLSSPDDVLRPTTESEHFFVRDSLMTRLMESTTSTTLGTTEFFESNGIDPKT
jgi:hypothetical protein